jgi:hypothetical protein
VGFGNEQAPRTVLVGEFAEMAFAFRGVMLVQAALKVVGVSDIESSLGIFEDVDVEFRHEISVIG